MNKVQKIMWRNKWLQKLDRDSRSKINCLRFSRNETYEHAHEKFGIVFARMIGWRQFDFKHFLTEVYSKNRRFRADVIIFTEPFPTVVEVASKSEKESSLERKMKFWQKEGFNFEVVRI